MPLLARWSATPGRSHGIGFWFAMRRVGGDFYVCPAEMRGRLSMRPPTWMRARPTFAGLNCSIHMTYRQSRTTLSRMNLPIFGCIPGARPARMTWFSYGKGRRNRGCDRWRQRGCVLPNTKLWHSRSEVIKKMLTITESGAIFNVGEIYRAALALSFPFCLVAIAFSSQSGLIQEFRTTSSHLQGSSTSFAMVHNLLA